MQTIDLVLKAVLVLALLTGAAPGDSSLAAEATDQPLSPALAAPAAIQPDLLTAARAQYHEGRFDEAIKLLAAPASADPMDFEINLLYAKALLGKCSQLKAFQDNVYQELVHRPYEIGLRLNRKSPYKPEPYYLVAKSLLINNRPAKAKRSIEKALYFANSSHTDYAAFMEVLGDCQAEQAGSDRQKLKEAAGAYKTALARGCDEPGFSERVKKKLKKIKSRVRRAYPNRGKKKKWK